MKTKTSSQLLRIPTKVPPGRIYITPSLRLLTRYTSVSISEPQGSLIPYNSRNVRRLATLSESTSIGTRPEPGLPSNSSGPPKPPQNDRRIKLGRTIRFLRSRLSTLLASPLPQEILSPHISLHLFPSTHPHLPTVSGRVAYHAALWSAPVAWGRFPILGNVKLEILDSRMMDEGGGTYGQRGREKLIIRWRTAGGPTSLAAGTARIAQLLGREPTSKDRPPPSPFHGLFVFTFDEAGRILTHTIEHSEESRDAEAATSKVFSLTDWLIKKARGQEERTPELTWSRSKITVLQAGSMGPRRYMPPPTRQKPEGEKPSESHSTERPGPRPPPQEPALPEYLTADLSYLEIAPEDGVLTKNKKHIHKIALDDMRAARVGQMRQNSELLSPEQQAQMCRHLDWWGGYFYYHSKNGHAAYNEGYERMKMRLNAMENVFYICLVAGTVYGVYWWDPERFWEIVDEVTGAVAWVKRFFVGGPHVVDYEDKDNDTFVGDSYIVDADTQEQGDRS